jgi:hypothetical protein
MKRGLLIGSGIFVLAIIVTIVFLAASLDSIIKEAVEEFGPEVTKADVRLEEVEISPTTGEGALRGLMIGNPYGFATKSAFELGAVAIKIDIDTITNDVIVIKEIDISAPNITYELGDSGSNIDAIQKNVDAYLKTAEAPAAKEETSGYGGGGGYVEEESSGPKLVIENLYIRDGNVNVSATFLGGKKMSVPLPTIHLKDIGKEEKGASPGEVAKEIFSAVGDGVTDAVSGLGLDKLMDNEVTKAVGEGAKAAGKTVTEGVDKAGEALKGLFGN